MSKQHMSKNVAGASQDRRGVDPRQGEGRIGRLGALAALLVAPLCACAAPSSPESDEGTVAQVAQAATLTGNQTSQFCDAFDKKEILIYRGDNSWTTQSGNRKPVQWQRRSNKMDQRFTVRCVKIWYTNNDYYKTVTLRGNNGSVFTPDFLPNTIKTRDVDPLNGQYEFEFAKWPSTEQNETMYQLWAVDDNGTKKWILRAEHNEQVVKASAEGDLSLIKGQVGETTPDWDDDTVDAVFTVTTVEEERVRFCDLHGGKHVRLKTKFGYQGNGAAGYLKSTLIDGKPRIVQDTSFSGCWQGGAGLDPGCLSRAEAFTVECGTSIDPHKRIALKTAGGDYIRALGGADDFQVSYAPTLAATAPGDWIDNTKFVPYESANPGVWSFASVIGGSMLQARVGAFTINGNTTAVIDDATKFTVLPDWVASWQFDMMAGTQAPALGNATWATLYNGASFTGTSLAPIDGRNFAALNLDGVDDYASIPNSASLNFGANDDFTVSVWINAATTQNTHPYPDNAVVEKWTGGGGYPYVIRYDNTKGTVIAARYDGKANPVVRSTTVIRGGWHHVAYVKSGPDLVLYVDGVENARTTDTTTGTTANTSPLYLGRRGTNAALSFTGQVDELYVFNRALRTEEVSAIMHR